MIKRQRVTVQVSFECPVGKPPCDYINLKGGATVVNVTKTEISIEPLPGVKTPWEDKLNEWRAIRTLIRNAALEAGIIERKNGVGVYGSCDDDGTFYYYMSDTNIHGEIECTVYNGEMRCTCTLKFTRAQVIHLGSPNFHKELVVLFNLWKNKVNE